MDYIKERKKIVDLYKSKAYLQNFEHFAMQIFRFQYRHNATYNNYCSALKIEPGHVKTLSQVPMLPIQFFKKYTVKTGNWQAQALFRSSGTSGLARSVHEVKSLNHYLKNALSAFSDIYGDASKISFLAILPGYEDRADSSLVQMVNALIGESQYSNSGFYLDRPQVLMEELRSNKEKGIPTILFGVSFGLLDLTRHEIDFPNLLVIETGGMKTSKLEMNKEQIIEKFKNAWNVTRVDSEYGMTELLSQSYAINDLWFRPACTKYVQINQLTDPFTREKNGKVGVINVIDLANYDTCSFIETEDLGIGNLQGQFQVVGRLANAELRGCNLLLEEI